MKVDIVYFHHNIPEGAVIYGKFTQPFGAGVDYETAHERLAVIIEHNGPNAYAPDFSDELAAELLEPFEFPNEGFEVTFYLFAMED